MSTEGRPRAEGRRADLMQALRETAEADDGLISATDVRVMIGIAPASALHSLAGFPAHVRRAVSGRNGRPALYRRSDIQQWYDERCRKRAERSAQRRAVAEAKAAQREAKGTKRVRKAEALREPSPYEPATSMLVERVDWASFLDHSDRPRVDGIDVSPAVLAAEAERDGGITTSRPRDQWDHLSIETDARPDPKKLVRSEAINARLDVLCLDGTRRKKHEPAPPTLAARVTDPELMMASVRARLFGHRPNIVRRSTTRVSREIQTAPTTMGQSVAASIQVGA